MYWWFLAVTPKKNNRGFYGPAAEDEMSRHWRRTDRFMNNLPASRDQCDGGPSCCCKTKSSTSGIAESLIIRRYEVPGYCVEKNGRHTFSLETTRKTLCSGESLSCSHIATIRLSHSNEKWALSLKTDTMGKPFFHFAHPKNKRANSAVFSPSRTVYSNWIQVYKSQTSVLQKHGKPLCPWNNKFFERAAN